MAWVYGPEGNCWINTAFIEQIITHETPMGKLTAYYDGEWIPIEDKWYEYPPEFKCQK